MTHRKKKLIPKYTYDAETQAAAAGWHALDIRDQLLAHKLDNIAKVRNGTYKAFLPECELCPNANDAIVFNENGGYVCWYCYDVDAATYLLYDSLDDWIALEACRPLTDDRWESAHSLIDALYLWQDHAASHKELVFHCGLWSVTFKHASHPIPCPYVECVDPIGVVTRYGFKEYVEQVAYA